MILDIQRVFAEGELAGMVSVGDRAEMAPA